MKLALSLLSTLSLFVCQCSISAQTVSDPSGHWEGRIRAEDMLFEIAIDLTFNSNGRLAGTFAQASQGINGLPLASVSVDGDVVRLVLRAGSGGGTFEARVSTDGKSMSGSFLTRDGNYTVPFELTRNGDARMAPPPRSATIAKDLESIWHATIDAGGQQERLVLTLKNEPDGTSTGTILSKDGSNVEIPVAVVRSGVNVTVDVPAVSASFTGVLNGATLSGTWTQGRISLPLVFGR